jgi:deoxycytidylate deaminase
MLINAGVKSLYYEKGYDDELADTMLSEAGIQVERYIP